ncbi:CCA tRNA nucleotidyltransferase [Candidatus Bathyarchaeota archaeon]|nr:MAG: CCA tRNA nucleotidyltransferase [Candidatus Bathyarchaeota archaeon]
MMEPEEVCSKVLEAITPTPEEEEEVLSIARSIMDKLRSLLAEEGVEAVVRLEGSLAKGTWLRGEADVDIFVRLKPDVGRDFLKREFMRIARRATEGYKQVERYAEHPYLECWAGGVRINLVPCYDVEKGNWLSATDRTPYHTDYVREHLPEELKGDVRLLKRFLKGIGAYGAEIKVGGFSGYLCELLIIYYGGFLEALRGSMAWRRGTLIDLEGYYRGREDEALEFFRHHLIVVDPVDPGRNVAAPVRLEKMCSFMAAAREFLSRPSEDFFFPRRPAPPGQEELKSMVRGRGTSILALRLHVGGLVPDVLWGQLHRTMRGLSGSLREQGFRVLRAGAWSDEVAEAIILFELEASELPPVVKKVGPPVWAGEHVERFLSKNMADPRLVCGPYIEGDRWVVLVRRRWPDAVGFLKAKLSEHGGRGIGVAPLLAQRVEEGFELLSGEEVVRLCRGAEGFREFLAEFLRGRPTWLAGRGGQAP